MLKPQRAFPIHDAQINDRGLSSVNGRLAEETGSRSIDANSTQGRGGRLSAGSLDRGPSVSAFRSGSGIVAATVAAASTRPGEVQRSTGCWKAARDEDSAGKEEWLAAKRAEEQQAATEWAEKFCR